MACLKGSYLIEDQCLHENFGLVSKGIGTQMNFNTTYHPETDRLTEGMNQFFEEMLRMHVLNQQKHWEEFFP
jgi:hypothetical protein